MNAKNISANARITLKIFDLDRQIVDLTTRMEKEKNTSLMRRMWAEKQMLTSSVEMLRKALEMAELEPFEEFGYTD